MREIVSVLISSGKGKKLTGFTFVETLIYTALIGLVISGFVSFSFVIVGLKNKNQIVREINDNLRETQNFIVHEIKEADAIISPTAGNASSSLVLAMPGGVEKIFLVESGVLKVVPAGGVEQSLTVNEVRVSDLNFANLANTGAKALIKTSLHMQTQGSSQEFRYVQNLTTVVCERY